MNILIWIIILLLFIISLVGTVVPLIPYALPLWLAFFISRFFEPGIIFPMSFWMAMVLITVAIYGSDIISGSVLVKKYGGTKLDVLAIIIGLFIGPIILGPPGIILGPFLAVFLLGFWQNSHDLRGNLQRAGLALIAVFSGWVIKIALQLLMIFWFLYLIIWS